MDYFQKRMIFALLFFGFTVNGLSLPNQVNQVAASAETLDPNCILTTSSDITGIGIRIAFYFQGLVTIFGPLVFNTEETESAFRNAFYTSVALVVSTFIYGRTPANLSLVDGLVVTFLPLLITTGAVYNAIIILKGKVTLQVAYMMHFIAMIAFGLTVWAHVDTYGTTPGCNLNSSVKFVVFGHTVAATNKRLRKFAIFTFVFSAVFIPLNALIFVIKQWAFPDADTDTDSNSSSDLGWIIALITWPMTILMCAVWVYDVVTIEQIIQRNGFSQATSQWTYGQTFAVVLMLGPVIDLGSALGRRMRRNSGERSCPRCSTKRADQNRENPQHQVG